jgi:aryl-alcohol dehydrogenase-like predicted oxidoreductase
VRYLEENVGAVDVDLDVTEVDELAEAVRPEEVAGERYPDMSSIDG